MSGKILKKCRLHNAFVLCGLVFILILRSTCYASEINLINEGKAFSSSSQRELLKNSNGNLQAIASSWVKCLHGNVLFGYGYGQVSSSITSTFAIENDCGVDINLSNYHMSFNAPINSNSQTIVLDPITQSNKGNLLALRFGLLPQNSGIDGILAGWIMVNPMVDNSALILSKGDMLIFQGRTSFSGRVSFNKTPDSSPIRFEIENPLSIGDAATFPYARDSLVDIPTYATGLKTLVVTNNSPQDIHNIKLMLQNNLPGGITYAMKYTTCKLDGTQKLGNGESCHIVLQYQPKFEGIVSNLPISISGIDDNLQLISTATINLPYSSRLTSHPQPGVLIGSDAKIGGISLTTPENIKYVRDSLESITVGGFGLKSYIVTNTSPVNLYAVTLPELSDKFSYDVRTTCSLKNKLVLYPNQSCLVVLKYTPTVHADKGVLNIQIAGIDAYYAVFANEVLHIPYSSNQ